MGVILRKRKNGDGTISLLLDIYHNGKRNYEFLTNLRLCKPVTPLDRKDNKERLQEAEQIRNKRAMQIQADEYDVTPAFRKGIDFLKYFESFLSNYKKQDKRVVEACFGKFKNFLAEESINEITSKRITASIVIQFKEYLLHSLNGETPANYFKKFKKVLRHGVKDKIFSPEIPALLSSKDKDMTVKTNRGIKKDILTFDEIKKLAETPVSNNEVKKAFLFSCLTGCRFCDVQALKWKNVQNGILNFVQQKTKVPVSINLNKSALNILGKAGKPDEGIFSLPSHNACLKNLTTWCKKAGIEKHITWHCARHSFGTGLVYYGADVKNASSLPGHSSLTYTDRYVRVVEKLKEKAVENLPEIPLG